MAAKDRGKKEREEEGRRSEPRGMLRLSRKRQERNREDEPRKQLVSNEKNEMKQRAPDLPREVKRERDHRLLSWRADPSKEK